MVRTLPLFSNSTNCFELKQFKNAELTGSNSRSFDSNYTKFKGFSTELGNYGLDYVGVGYMNSFYPF